jgi:hypothetical protein
MMRFRGGGVGHASTREATDFFKQDRDSHDAKRLVEEDDEDYDQTQHEPKAPTNQSKTDRDDEEEDYGYNRGQFSDTEEEDEEEDEYLDDKIGLDDNGEEGYDSEVMDDLGYGEM